MARAVATLFALALSLALSSPARVVEYHFHVSYFEVSPEGDDEDTFVRGVNGLLPGPEIRVKHGERLLVHVFNDLPTESVSFHWHGFEMRSAWDYDGAVGITQCGIPPGANFTYDFIVDEHPGTYQYHEHAHMAHVAARGLFGPLIVEPPDGEADPWSYDGEANMMLFDWWQKSSHDVDMGKWAGTSKPSSVSKDYNDIGLNQFHNLLLNGKGGFAIFGRESPGPGWVTEDTRVEDLDHLTPRAGETWRLRVQNAGALYAIRFRIDGHRMTVVQTDAADVEPYTCDALSLASGERFDVLVTFDQTPGSYWIRLETLEYAFGYHHGQLGVLRYDGTPAGVLPTLGFPINHDFFSAPSLVTINCVDQGPLSPTCQPITALRLRKRVGYIHPPVPDNSESVHDFELNFRGYGAPDNSHFTRLIDLTKTPNTYGQDQFAGDYVQFLTPSVPYSHVNGTKKAEFENTLRMEVAQGETVRVILQIQDRTAHPWHLHGHKFAVLGTWMPDYHKECDVLFCRSSINPWLSRDGLPDSLLDPAVAPMKDTVQVPAGGWVVIQFTADNPGWWFFHCHMLIHHHDGMAVVVEEALPQIPHRYWDKGRFDALGFPTCLRELEDLSAREASDQPGGPSCPCWQDPEKFYGNELHGSYRCSHPYLCGHQLKSELDPQVEQRFSSRNRAAGRPWRWAYTGVLLTTVIILFMLKARNTRRRIAYAQWVQEVGCAAKLANRQLLTTPDWVGGSMELNIVALDLPQVRLPVYWKAFCKDSSTAGWQEVEGNLDPGMVMAVVGSNTDTTPWLNFFSGYYQEQIKGLVTLGGLSLPSWKRRGLHEAICYIGSGESELLRPGSTCADAIEFPVRMLGRKFGGRNNEKYLSETARTAKIARVLMVFGLLGDADKLVKHLSLVQLRHVIAAGSLVLPRGLIVLEDPLSGLDPDEIRRTLTLFRLLAEKTGVIVVFSCTSLSAEDSKNITKRLECSGDHVKYSVVNENVTPLSGESCILAVDGHSSRLDLKECSLPQAFHAFWVLLWTELVQASMAEQMTIYTFCESLGVGLGSGLVWLSCNSIDTQVALSETAGLLFFSTAIWTIPPAFQALAITRKIVARVKHDVLNGLYNVPVFVLTLLVNNFCMSLLWVALWQCLAYTLSDVGADLRRMLMMHLVITLNVVFMRGLGMVLGVIVPRAAAGAVVCNIIAQMQMLTNGFYTKLDPSLRWIVEVSIPRLAFRALQKLEFSWKDTFEVHPMMGSGMAGAPMRFIPAELTGFFGLMRDRGMQVMQSPEPSDWALPEILRLTASTLLCYAVFGLALYRHIRSCEMLRNDPISKLQTGAARRVRREQSSGVYKSEDEMAERSETSRSATPTTPTQMPSFKEKEKEKVEAEGECEYSL